MSSDPARGKLLVLGDSLSYYGPKGGLPADHPDIWPNLVAREFGWDAEIIARIGWTCRDAYWALVQDPRVWAAVPDAQAVIIAVGGMDTLPSPLPTALREQIRYLRPPALRRRVREAYGWLQPRLSKLGWPLALPAPLSVDYLEQIRAALSALRPELPIVAVLPGTHHSAAYGYMHTGRERAVQMTTDWAAAHGVPLVDLTVASEWAAGEWAGNPDGIHWGWQGHENVAREMIGVLEFVNPRVS